jgi:hypothetical protein
MNGPEDTTPPRRSPGDIERPIDATEAREAEETTEANLEMNEEFIDAGNEAHLRQDAGIDDQPGDGGPDDDVDTAFNSGIVRSPAG